MFEQVSDAAVEQRAKLLDDLKFDPRGSLLVEERDGVPVEIGRSRDIDDFHLVLAHQAREVAAEHGALQEQKIIQQGKKT